MSTTRVMFALLAASVPAAVLPGPPVRRTCKWCVLAAHRARTPASPRHLPRSIRTEPIRSLISLCLKGGRRKARGT
jgi:hypothetical protein